MPVCFTSSPSICVYLLIIPTRYYLFSWRFLDNQFLLCIFLTTSAHRSFDKYYSFTYSCEPFFSSTFWPSLTSPVRNISSCHSHHSLCQPALR